MTENNQFCYSRIYSPEKYYMSISSKDEDHITLMTDDPKEDIQISTYDGLNLRITGPDHIDKECLEDIYHRVNSEVKKLHDEFGGKIDRLVNRLIEENNIQ